MSAPTRGTLVVTDNGPVGRVHLRLPGCNPSLVWSADSRALAVPQWTDTGGQHLVVVSLPGGAVRRLNPEFRVLELHAFEAGRVQGIDSPVHLPRAVDISVTDLIRADDAAPATPPAMKEGPPMSEQSAGLVTVLQTNDSALLAIAESMLTGEDIPYIAKGGGLRNLVVPDGLGVSSNLAVGVVELQVSPDDAEDARAVLQDLLRDMEKS